MKRPATLSAPFVRTIRRPGRYGDGRGGHGLSCWSSQPRSRGGSPRPGLRESVSTANTPTGGWVATQRSPRPKPAAGPYETNKPSKKANTPKSGERQRFTRQPRTQSNFIRPNGTGQQVRRNLARNPRHLCESPPWQQRGRSNHHSQHHGLPYPYMAPKARNRSPYQTTHLRSHDDGDQQKCSDLVTESAHLLGA